MSERHGVLPKRLREKPRKKKFKDYVNLPENDPRKKKHLTFKKTQYEQETIHED